MIAEQTGNTKATTTAAVGYTKIIRGQTPRLCVLISRPGIASGVGLPGGARMIGLLAGMAAMYRGFDGLPAVAHEHFAFDPVSGYIDIFLLRGRRGDLVKLLWWDGEFISQGWRRRNDGFQPKRLLGKSKPQNFYVINLVSLHETEAMQSDRTQ